jgi:hypothetical protein
MKSNRSPFAMALTRNSLLATTIAGACILGTWAISGTGTATRYATRYAGPVDTTAPKLVDWTPDSGATESIVSDISNVETVKIALSAPLPLSATKLFVRVSTKKIHRPSMASSRRQSHPGGRRFL